ncbi:MAG: ATP-binding protein [Gammaproteobacteria bacterium]|nr:ATP-binding protein [Gammaproteobacteria bacterium]MDH5651950.1 ATP-binding protein [Gammaproteobacteria bacterium]
MNRGRILYALGGTVLISLVVFTSISYYSYVESARQQDYFHLRQFADHIKDMITAERNHSSQHDAMEIHHVEYVIFLYSKKAGPLSYSRISERRNLLEQLFPFEPLSGRPEEFGSEKLNGGLYYWIKLPVGNNGQQLFLIHESENLLLLFIKSFGPSLFVFSLFLIWSAVWGSLILGNLFGKLNDKTNLLQEQTREIIKARDAAFAADRAKSRFLANISHELRTPLTAIIGFSETMYEDGIGEAQRRVHLETIIRNSNYLLHIINELLDQSKIDEDKLQVESIRFSPVLLLKDIESLVRQQIESKGLEFRMDLLWPLPEKLWGDPLRVKQVILNLVANAIKFTEHGKIHLTVSCTPETEQWCIVVDDTGIGISAGQQEAIFAPFIQADISITRKYGGTGLGLSLSKRLVELMGGRVSLTSEPGQGSRFLIELPTGSIKAARMLTAVDAEQIAADPFSLDAVVMLQGRVLVAEDAPDNQILIKAILEKAGLSVRVVGDGRQAVEAAREEHWDLILMDMQMPVMDGITALQQLRKQGIRTPVIALTANTQPEDRALYAEAGFDDFVGKPIRRRILYSVLVRLLETAKSRDIIQGVMKG